MCGKYTTLQLEKGVLTNQRGDGCRPTVLTVRAPLAVMATHVAKKMKLEHAPVDPSADLDVAVKEEDPSVSSDEEEDEAATSAIAQFQSEDVRGS
ncbi:unnamed protein product [Phytophthora fragariaefolia]|uniref:Unnamed protein product n=1 Tax=Phytophthora fragariaefolia TaxID=1490495 RepID=A0A9W6YFY6_9STRA|nr:unnamed protein product [Phytophthora fragariaefolia]